MFALGCSGVSTTVNFCGGAAPALAVMIASMNMSTVLQAPRGLLQAAIARALHSVSSPLPACRHRSFQSAAPRLSSCQKVDLSSPKNEFIDLKLSSDARIQDIPPSDLEVYPNFLTSDEQQVLLTAALKKLDSMASREERKRRRDWNKANKAATGASELKSEC